MSGDRTDLCHAASVFGGQFKKRASCIQHIALGAYFAAHALGPERTCLLIGGISFRQTPTSFFIHIEHRRRIDGDHFLRNRSGLCSPSRSRGIVCRSQLQRRIQIVSTEFACHKVERLELSSSRMDHAAVHLLVTDASQTREDLIRLRLAWVPVAVVKPRRDSARIAIRLQTHPDPRGVRWKRHPVTRMGGQFDIGELCPRSVSFLIRLKGELHALVALIDDMHSAVIIPCKQVGLAGDARFHCVRKPHGTPSDHRADLVQLFRLHKPKIGVRATRSGDVALGLAFVEEFTLRRVIAAKDNALSPPREVADDF